MWGNVSQAEAHAGALFAVHNNQLWRVDAAEAGTGSWSLIDYLVKSVRFGQDGTLQVTHTPIGQKLHETELTFKLSVMTPGAHS